MAKVYTEVLSGGQSYPVWDKAAHADITNLSGNFTAHSANNDMHTTTAEKAAWNAKLGPDALNNYYTKSETSGAEQISGALNALDQQLNAYTDSVAAAIAAGSAAGDWVTTNGSTVLKAVTDVGTVSGNLESLSSTVTAHTADKDVHVTTADKNKWNSYDGAISEQDDVISSLSDRVNTVETNLDNKADKTELNSYVLNTTFEEYKTSVADNIASGVAAKKWIDNFTPTSPLTAGNFISIENDVVSVTGLDTLISCNNGISAEWNTETSGWDIGLEKENLAYARYTANHVAAAEEASDVTVGDLFEAERYADKITRNEDNNGLLLEAGLYHVDIRLTLNVSDPTPAYNTVKLVCGFSPDRTTEHELDCSYVHNESICLSFDAMVGANGTAAIKIENLPKGVGYTLSNFNIHEIVNVAGILASSQTDIVAGDGLSKDGNELAVKLGGGLKFDNDKNLTIAVGNGLKISESQLTLVLDDVAEETVQEVQQISNDLDEKVTTTYAQANITETADMTSQASIENGTGCLIGYLFSVPIKNTVYIQGDVDEEGKPADKVTVVGLYCSQALTVETPVIVGLYEYDPSVKRVAADGKVTYGKTIAFCDTGPVTIEKGYHEYPMKNFNTAEAEKTLKSSNMYYAAIYISQGVAGGSNLKIASCQGYTDAFNDANPLLSVDQVNIEIDIRNGKNPNTSFNDFGFSWRPDHNNPGQYITNDYHERPSLHRPFMQFRNKPL